MQFIPGWMQGATSEQVDVASTLHAVHDVASLNFTLTLYVTFQYMQKAERELRYLSRYCGWLLPA
jgi:hypothetical protein